MAVNLIADTEAYVKSEMSSNDSSHDWNHIERVRRLAHYIAKEEGLDGENQLIVELSALLHDIKDWKYSGSETEGVLATRKFLTAQGISNHIIDEVCYVIGHVGFSKEIGGNSHINIESNLDRKGDMGVSPRPILAAVQDADRLDALGAIGIARCLTYGGAKHRILYDPNIPPRDHLNEKEYKYGQSTTINHFNEKLFKLKDMMKTHTGRKIAEKRHQLMVDFISQFENEWDGLDY